MEFLLRIHMHFFFTFHALSYVIDDYRQIPAQKDLFSIGLYIAFFLLFGY